LKYVSLNSTGFNQVDLVAAKEHGISIANVPGFSTDSVAEQAIGLMFATLRHIPMGDREMRKKPFQIDPANRSQDIYVGANVRGKTLGIIGLGQIGTRVAEIGRGLGMEVLAFNRTPKQVGGVRMVDLDMLLKTSDVISINAAFVDGMKNLVDEKAIGKMKPSAVLVNTARGDFVDEGVLAKALSEKRIAGYGTDVLANWTTNNPLLALENITLTPHSGFFTAESLKNMGDIIVSNIESYIAGTPQNVVNA
jgi:glyoxylate reductase